MAVENRRNLIVNSLLTVALLALVAILLNYLSIGSFARVDLTKDDEYTLSPAARTIVRGLEAPVRIEVFLSKNLPPQFALHTQRIQDKLAEFAEVAEVPFELVYTDPGEDEEAKERAQRLGVTPRETSARSKGKLEAQITWLGLAIHHKDQEEVLPFVDSTATLEYEVARALRSMESGGKKKVIGIAVGHEEPDLAAALEQEDNPLKPVAQVLTDSYELKSVDLATEGEVPGDVDVLLVMGAQKQPGERALWAVDQFVMRGGSVGIFPLAAMPNPMTRQVQPAPADYSKVLNSWGISLGKDLIVDRQLNGIIRLPVAVRTPRGVMRADQQVNSPLVPIVRDLDREHPVTRRLETLVAPFSNAIDSRVAAANAALKVSVLARSTPQATVGAKIASLDPRTLAETQPGEAPGPHAVLVAVNGRFPSAFRGQAPPPLAAEEEDAAAGEERPPGLPPGMPPLPGMEPRAEAADEGAAAGEAVADGLGAEADAADSALSAPQEAPEGTRLLLGSSFEMPLSNPGLLLAVIDWLAADETLLSIRPRMSAPAVLELPDARTVQVVKQANVIGPPLLVSLFGVLRLRRRKKQG
jgi:ABC-type uncharacterized transport system involved in gliding motility auxiliary subunit